MPQKIQMTITIEEEVKRDFHLMCVRNGVSMSETVENMMSRYIQLTNALLQSKDESEG